ncbi:Gfo/Idh/MocA family protein [Planctomicrobium piriforme]|uniref:Predicted dehydrogenase n=1 Tax=Planctomicrobium piriforme TaxID=1576369 RepID=A0A1I3T0Q4_9PLAN|nr:Gfo/Idh/MocA family oxidoreductase [Planctomicrobium piriforme]SFJ63137.1 Predicted dehydrogenase [Planctomicrobium piriforme]
MAKSVRIGLVGAGGNTRLKHIPGLQAIDGVEIVGVANRSAESSAAVAAEFGIPKVYDNWQALVADPNIDAVVIGTWPNMHCEITCAALAAGKHVLCESRMSRNLAEAREMLAASKKQPGLVAQLVPSPYGLISGPAVHQLLKGHFVGDLREVIVIGANDQFWDYSQPLHWRQDAEISGKNVLMLGILQETLMRWAPQPVQVFAQTELFEPTRPLPEESRFAEATVPDSVQILAELQSGARVIYHFSGVILFGPGVQIHFYGSRGTVKVHFVNGEERVYAGRGEDQELKEIEIPAEERGQWQVEADFIAAIRGEKKVTLTDFATGVQYMEFLEAVARSAEENAPVEFPLD